MHCGPRNSTKFADDRAEDLSRGDDPYDKNAVAEVRDCPGKMEHILAQVLCGSAIQETCGRRKPEKYAHVNLFFSKVEWRSHLAERNDLRGAPKLRRTI